MTTVNQLENWRQRPEVTLVLPPHLTESETVKAVLMAFRHLRASLATRITIHKDSANRALAAGNEIEEALQRGQALASADAAASLDEEFAERLNVLDEYFAQLDEQA